MAWSVTAWSGCTCYDSQKRRCIWVVLLAHGDLNAGQTVYSECCKENSALPFQTSSPKLLRLPGWRKGSAVSHVHAISAIMILRITWLVKLTRIALNKAQVLPELAGHI
jgi:hypothetical protein